ncbi:hypothetical protein LXA43DRAFT_886436 [Ganoderma leucocontextum]|nr:hypothetical protein LXA43DRAFT_886436 [Ganoderma leucocontextum]
MRPPGFIHDVSFDCPTIPSSDEERRFQFYLLLKQLTCYDHRDPMSYKTLYAEGKRCLSSYPAWKLERGADLHDGRLMLELCIRYVCLPPRITNCEVDRHAANICSRGVPGLLYDLIVFPDHSAPHHIFNCTPAVKIRALALMLWTEFISVLKLREDSKRASVLAILPHMALHADSCARVDFLPPVVIRVAYWMSTYQPRYGVDTRKLPMFANHAHLPSLWKAYNDYVQNQNAEELKRLAKVSAAPNRYRCAADRCGIQAINRSALRKCGGECREDTKPYYCSPDCQRKHWLVHRYACRSSARRVNPIAEDDCDPDWIDIETYKPDYDDHRLTEDDLYAHKKGPEIFIDIPNVSACREGEVVRVRTRTLSPAFLRSYRASWKFIRHRDVFVTGSDLVRTQTCVRMHSHLPFCPTE